MKDHITSNVTLANEDGAHKAVMCDQSFFFSVFYGRDALAEVEDNKPDAISCRKHDFETKTEGKVTDDKSKQT